MLLIAFFSDKGVPKVGLNPTIDVWEDDATHVVNAQAMVEIAGGFYKYDFAGYDEGKDYSIRADGGAGLANNDRYCFSSNEIGQVTEDLTTVQADLDNPNQYKANVAALALEASLQLVKTETDKIQPDIIAVPNTYKANIAALALEATAQLIKTEADKIQPDIIAVPNNYKADVSNLDVAVSTRSSHAAADVWAVGVRTLTSFGTLIADIWTHAARTLTSFGTLVVDIWTHVARTLTAGTRDTEIDAIKLETDKIQPDIIGSADNYKADVTALALEVSVQSVKTETDKIIHILGLVQENFRLKNQAYNAAGNLLSATIRIYGSAADCDADVNEIAEYTMTATYDGSGNCTSYKVTKV